MLVEHDGKLAEMHAEMAKIAEPSRFVTSCSKLFTPTGRVYQAITKLTQPLDPKIEWPLVPTMTSS